MAWVSEIAMERHELGAVRLFGVEWRSVWRGPAPLAEHRSGRVDELVFATAEDASTALEIVAELVSPQRGAIDPRDHAEIVRRYRRAALAMSRPHRVPAPPARRYPPLACVKNVATSSTSTRSKRSRSAPASAGAAGTSR